LHFNKTRNKEFTNYQIISIIILFTILKNSLRDFIEELKESKQSFYLGLKKIQKKINKFNDGTGLILGKEANNMFLKLEIHIYIMLK
jgi:hypothetical protein